MMLAMGVMGALCQCREPPLPLFLFIVIGLAGFINDVGDVSDAPLPLILFIVLAVMEV